MAIVFGAVAKCLFKNKENREGGAGEFKKHPNTTFDNGVLKKLKIGSSLKCVAYQF